MKKRRDNHLAEGEVTGHYHAACGEGIEIYDLDDVENGPKLLKAPEGAEVTHQEHNRIPIAAGDYDVSGVVEYDPFEDAIARVRD